MFPASPSVTFVVSFFAVFLGCSLCTKEEEFYCVRGRSEGRFRKMTLVFTCFAVFATYERVSLSHGYRGRFPGNSLVLAKFPTKNDTLKVTLGLRGLQRGGVKNRNKGGCKRLFAFVHVCSRLLAFALRLLAFACVCLRLRLCVCLRLSAFVCVCLRLLAFAYAPLCCPPLCVPLIGRARVFGRSVLFMRGDGLWLK